MSYPVTNNAVTQTNQDNLDTSDYNTDYDSDFDSQNVGDSSSSEFVGDGGNSSPSMSIQDLRTRVLDLTKQLNQNKDLSASDKQDIRSGIAELSAEINSVTFVRDRGKKADALTKIEAELGTLETSILGIPADDNNLPGGWGEDAPTEKPVSKSDIQALLKSIQNGERQPQEGSGLTKDQCIKELTDALNHYSVLHPDDANSSYSQVLDAVGGQMDPAEVVAQNYGATPTSIDGSTLHFDGSKGDQNDFSLKSNDMGKTIIVDNATTVGITPKNKDDQVTMTEDGSYIDITIGSDTFKVSKDADIHIYSDHVTGEVSNTDGKIVTGADGSTESKYIDPKKRADIQSKLVDALSKMGYAKVVQDGIANTLGIYNQGSGALSGMSDPNSIDTSSVKYGVGWHGDGWTKVAFGDPNTFNSEYESEVNDAKSVIQAVSDAIGEPDPTKQKKLWDQAIETLSRIGSQTEDSHNANNKGQLIFNVLYGELGEDGLKSALENGLIPGEFATQLSSLLTTAPDENTNLKDEITTYQIGGPNWSHQTSSDFLKKHSGGSSSSDSPPSN